MTGDNSSVFDGDRAKRFEEIIQGRMCAATIVNASVYVGYFGEVSVETVLFRANSGKVYVIVVNYNEERAVLKRFVGPSDQLPSINPMQPGEWEEVSAAVYLKEGL